MSSSLLSLFHEIRLGYTEKVFSNVIEQDIELWVPTPVLTRTDLQPWGREGVSGDRVGLGCCLKEDGELLTSRVYFYKPKATSS